MLEIAMEIAKENKDFISKFSAIRGMEIIFEKLMEKFNARLGEITISELDGFRAATIHAYETVIDGE